MTMQSADRNSPPANPNGCNGRPLAEEKMESTIDRQSVISCINCTKRLTQDCPVYRERKQVFDVPEYQQVVKNKYCDQFFLLRRV